MRRPKNCVAQISPSLCVWLTDLGEWHIYIGERLYLWPTNSNQPLYYGQKLIRKVHIVFIAALLSGELGAVLVIVDINEVLVTARLTKVFCPGHPPPSPLPPPPTAWHSHQWLSHSCVMEKMLISLNISFPKSQLSNCCMSVAVWEHLLEQFLAEGHIISCVCADEAFVVFAFYYFWCNICFSCSDRCWLIVGSAVDSCRGNNFHLVGRVQWALDTGHLVDSVQRAHLCHLDHLATVTLHISSNISLYCVSTTFFP